MTDLFSPTLEALEKKTITIYVVLFWITTSRCYSNINTYVIDLSKLDLGSTSHV